MNDLLSADMNQALIRAAQQQQAQQAQMLDKAGTVKNYAKIEQAAQDFEAVFLAEMMKPMFKEINKPDPLFGGGHGEQVFNDMMVQEYGKIMAEQGGVGLADYVKAELIKLQELQEAQ